MLTVFVGLCATGAAARDADDVPDISDVRLLRKMQKYSQALEYVNVILADKSAPEDIRRQAYNELVTITLATSGESEARTAARQALTEYRDLEADSSHYPAQVQTVYDNLRKVMFGRIYLDGHPAGCSVYFGDQEIGKTPLEGAYLPPGEHELRVSKSAYAAETIEVSITAGDTARYEVTLHLYSEAHKTRFGLEVDVSRLSMNYEAASVLGFAGIGTFTDWEATRRFGAGVFGYFPMHDRAAFQVGLRYYRAGDKATYNMVNGMPSGEYETVYQYLAVPIVYRHYLSSMPKICLCIGAELAYLLAADLTSTTGDDQVDLSDRVNPIQASFVLGAGYEVAVGDHYLMFSLLYVNGLMEIGDDDHPYDANRKPRAWRFVLGFML